MFKNPAQITDIFFDLDHTLWDFEKNSALAFQKVFEKHRVELDFLEFIKVYEGINQQYWKLYREEKVTKQELRRGRLNDVFDKFGVRYPLAFIDAMAESYIDFLPENNFLFDGTFELLDYLKPKYKLHIITNGFEEVQTRKLQNSNIAVFFNTVTNSERVGVKKPNPKIFQYALHAANTLPQKSVMIGDNLEADILGAEAVGFNTIHFVQNTENFEHHTVRVSSLLEIKNHL
jgi:putative hydrolase of the HAD superfamily